MRNRKNIIQRFKPGGKKNDCEEGFFKNSEGQCVPIVPDFTETKDGMIYYSGKPYKKGRQDKKGQWTLIDPKTNQEFTTLNEVTVYADPTERKYAEFINSMRDQYESGLYPNITYNYLTGDIDNDNVEWRNYGRAQKSPYATWAEFERAAARRMKRENEGQQEQRREEIIQNAPTISQAGPKRPTWEKALAIATHPLTAFGYSVRGQWDQMPDYFEKGDVNPFDRAIQATAVLAGLRGVAPYLSAPAVIGSRTIPWLTGSNLLWGTGAYLSGDQLIDPNSATRTSINKAIENPTFDNVAGAIGNTGLTALGFYGLPVRSGLLSLGDDFARGVNYVANMPSSKVLFQSPQQRLNNPISYRLATGLESGFRGTIAQKLNNYQVKQLGKKYDKLNNQLFDLNKSGQGNSELAKDVFNQKQEISNQILKKYKDLDDWRIFNYSGLPIKDIGLGGGEGRVFLNALDDNQLVKIGNYLGDERSIQNLINIGKTYKPQGAEIAFPTGYVKFGNKTWSNESVPMAQFLPRLKFSPSTFGLKNYNQIGKTIDELDQLGVGIDYQGSGNIGSVGDKLGLVDLTYIGKPGNRIVTGDLANYRFGLNKSLEERIQSQIPRFKLPIQGGWGESGNYLALGEDVSQYFTGVAQNADNTITSVGNKILDDLGSPEGIRRLRNQFKEANSNLTDEQLDYLVANRINEAQTAIQNNTSRFFLDKGRGMMGSESAPFVSRLFPAGNAQFISQTPFKNINSFNAPTELFPQNTVGNIPNTLNLSKPSGNQLFANPNYDPGTIALSDFTQGSRSSAAHEVAHSLQATGEMPIDQQVREFYQQNRGLVDDYIKSLGDEQVARDFKYFMDANGRTYKNENLPFIAEFRQSMLDHGLINSRYQPINPSKLNEAAGYVASIDLNNLPNAGSNFLRGNRIIKFTPPSLYQGLSDLMNRAPLSTIGATGASGLGLNFILNKSNNKSSEFLRGGLINYLRGYKK